MGDNDTSNGIKWYRGEKTVHNCGTWERSYGSLLHYFILFPEFEIISK